MRITINFGVDNILFGMTEAEVICALGQPDKTVVTDYDDRELYYNQHKLVLKIEIENNARLGWIEVHNCHARWSDIDLCNIQRATLLELLSAELGDSYECEDYGHMESYSFNKHWIELQYEFDELTSFNFGVPYDDNDKPLWPIPRN